MLDLELVSQNIDIEKFLFTHLRVRYLGKSGNNYTILCPDPTHIDKHPSCFFHKEKLVYHCFGCSSRGSLVDLIMLTQDVDADEAETIIKKFIGMEIDAVASTLKTRYEKYNLKPVILSTQFRSDWENARYEIQEFVEKKNYNLALFDKYYIGYNNGIGSITFPIIYGNRVINVGERYVLGDQDSKIKYRKGVPLALSVWGIFDGYDPSNPFFTEGIADALRMREAGYNAYALLSIVLPNGKMRFLLDHFEGTFTIVPDGDHGGDKMIEIWKKCEHHTRVMVMQPKHDDIDATPINEIHRLVKGRISMREFMVGKCDSGDSGDFICEGIDER